MGARILLADDDPVIRLALSARLRAWGYEPSLAADVEGALRITRRTAPDVVVSDLVFPGRSGLELLREVKAHEPAPAVILITAHGGLAEAVEALREGAEDFLTKPLETGKLKRVLARATAGSGGRPGGGGIAGRAPLGRLARRAERVILEEASRVEARREEDGG